MSSSAAGVGGAGTEGAGGGGEGFWTRTSGVIAIVGILVGNILVTVFGMVAIKELQTKTKEAAARRARDRREAAGTELEE